MPNKYVELLKMLGAPQASMLDTSPDTTPQHSEYVPSDKDRFLSKIAQLESSGGKNINHNTIDDGLQSGQTAIGQYGLLPNTVNELVNRARLSKTLTPDLQDLDGMEPHEMKDAIESNPELEKELANRLASHVIDRQGGDLEKAAYAYTNGHNLSPTQITPDKLNNSPYVQKFRKISSVIR